MNAADATLAVDYTTIGGQNYAVIERSNWEAWLAWLRSTEDLDAVHAAAGVLGHPDEPFSPATPAEPPAPDVPLMPFRRHFKRTWHAVMGRRSPSTALVIAMLVVTLLFQQIVTRSLEFGVFAKAAPHFMTNPAMWAWSIARAVLVLGVVVFWLMHEERNLFRSIIIAAYALTIGLALNLLALLFALVNISAGGADILLMEGVLIAVTNILLFAVWYWIIDPPGLDEVRRTGEPWDFLFPQRANEIPYYSKWEPRSVDYLFLAFTTTFAFSPTDTLPLTRRAKYLMMLQSTISVICISVVVSRAINILS